MEIIFVSCPTKFTTQQFHMKNKNKNHNIAVPKANIPPQQNAPLDHSPQIH
jgi:hypothetical protein